jgi:hypothetical protein
MRSSMRPASRSILSCASIGCSWRRLNLDGRPSLVFHLPGMQPGDLPVAGHWTGGLKAGPGFYRPADGSWHLFDSAESPAEALAGDPFRQPRRRPPPRVLHRAFRRASVCRPLEDRPPGPQNQSALTRPRIAIVNPGESVHA